MREVASLVESRVPLVENECSIRKCFLRRGSRESKGLCIDGCQWPDIGARGVKSSLRDRNAEPDWYKKIILHRKQGSDRCIAE